MTIQIDETAAGKTIREYLREELGYSGGMLKRLKFMDNGITVNGKFVTVRYVLQAGDSLQLRVEDRPEDTCPYMVPVDLPLKIAYEDAHLTAVDKPPAMPAHPSYSHRLDTVANALAFRYAGTPFVFRPVNRLDRDTSGLMLTARTRLAASQMYRHMIGGNIRKLYIAILCGTPRERCGEIRLPVCRCNDSIIMRRVAAPGETGAKDAHTFYRVLFASKIYTVVLAAPITGRTHQLRVHFSAIGCPLAGDTMYGGSNADISRHALHAAHLSFPHPQSGRSISLYSPLPDDMAAICPIDQEILEKAVQKEAETYFQDIIAATRLRG
ncbi:MAG: RluA family pseudouridine synthase [Clostridiales bacterium]|jgi:23S rRNA pseudouridine1911/1915/1917 synthase|nr:RluA family pseudouridine synthase [Clostridiales bacterium]